MPLASLGTCTFWLDNSKSGFRMYREYQAVNSGELSHTQGPSEYSHTQVMSQGLGSLRPQWPSWGHTATGAKIQSYRALWLWGGEGGTAGSLIPVITHTGCGDKASKLYGHQKFKISLRSSVGLSLAWATWHPIAKDENLSDFFFSYIN